jgi:hypothetical protein
VLGWNFEGEHNSCSSTVIASLGLHLGIASWMVQLWPGSCHFMRQPTDTFLKQFTYSQLPPLSLPSFDVACCLRLAGCIVRTVALPNSLVTMGNAQECFK